MLFTPGAGSDYSADFLVIDANGVAGYQAGADYVIGVPSTISGLSVSDFTT